MDTAILRGVTKYIHNNLEHWNELNCKAMPDGRPEPMIGKDFCSVHITESQGTVADQGLLREVWGFGVTVTRRLEAVPYDKIMQAIYLGKIQGLDRLVNQLKYAISNRGEVRVCIESCLPTEEQDPELFKFIDCIAVTTPPIFVSRNPKFRFRDEEWFHGTHSNPARNRNDGHVGISFTMNFGRLEFQISQKEGTC